MLLCRNIHLKLRETCEADLVRRCTRAQSIYRMTRDNHQTSFVTDAFKVEPIQQEKLTIAIHCSTTINSKRRISRYAANPPLGHEFAKKVKRTEINTPSFFPSLIFTIRLPPRQTFHSFQFSCSHQPDTKTRVSRHLPRILSQYVRIHAASRQQEDRSHVQISQPPTQHAKRSLLACNSVSSS